MNRLLTRCGEENKLDKNLNDCDNQKGEGEIKVFVSSCSLNVLVPQRNFISHALELIFSLYSSKVKAEHIQYVAELQANHHHFLCLIIYLSSFA